MLPHAPASLPTCSRPPRGLIALLTLALASAAASAQAPPNDLCQNATTLPVCVPKTGSNQFAGTEGSASCSPSSRDIFYSVTPPASGLYTLGLCRTAEPFASVLSIHTGCPATAANQIACADHGCAQPPPGGMPRIHSVSLQAGVSYLVRIAGGGSAGMNRGETTIVLCGVEGSCCNPATGLCTPAQIDNCDEAVNIFTPGGTCGPGDTCPVQTAGACCDTSTGACTIRIAFNCLGGSYYFYGAGTTCATSPCAAILMPGPGKDCDDAIDVSTLPWFSTLSLLGVCDDSPVTCSEAGTRVFRAGVWHRQQSPNPRTLRVRATSVGGGGGTAGAPVLISAYIGPCDGLIGLPAACGLRQLTLTAPAGAAVRIIAGTDDPDGLPAPYMMNFALWRVPTGALCADVNFSGSVTVQDLFDFLGFYFGGDPRADVNNSGTETVQDLFDFLGMYFQGCP